MPSKTKQSLLQNLSKNQTRVYVDLSEFSQEPEEELSNNSISTTTEPKDFSFKGKLANNEFVQNPNIFEKQDYNRAKNKGVIPEDKFSEVDDPIYDFDETLPEILQKRKTKKPSLKKIAKKVKTTRKVTNKYNAR